MTSGQKIAFSLLSAFVLFAVLVLSLHSALFKTLETRFYAQSKIEENTGQLDKISESCDSYISEILSFVEKGDNAWTKNASVRSYYVQNPSESDVNTRRKLTENLFADIPVLSGIRIVDKNGKNVHYSSFDDTDLLKQNGISKTYKNYSDIIKDAGEISFEDLQKASSETKTVLLCDENRGRLILSVPFCWVDGIYSGMALFYFNLSDVENELIRRNVLAMGQAFTLFADDDFDGGFVLNIPRGTKAEFRTPFLSYWKARSQVMRGGDELQQPEKLLAKPEGGYYVGLSSNRIGKIRVSAVYTNDIFELSAEIRILIYFCIFISILLVVFLIFSFIRDPMVTLQKRIKKIQLEIVEDFIDGKEKREWSDVARHLRQRKNDLSDDIIKSLHVASKKRRKELSDYLDKNWDEIFAIFDSKTEGASSNAAAGSGSAAGAAELTGASIAEIRRMLEEVLQNRNIVAPVAAATVAAGAVTAVKAAKKPVEEPDEIEEVEELAEDAEELDEVEELAEDAEEVDEVEELAEDAEEVDEVEELTEEAEDVDELDEVEELDDAEELDVLEEADDEPAPASKSSLGFDDAFFKSIVPPKKEYIPSNETFFSSENFANVDNLFAEELKLGDFSNYYGKTSEPFEFKPYKLPDYEDTETEPEAEPVSETEAAPEVTEESSAPVEELTEEVPDYLPEPDFSMISFADNLTQEIPELEGEGNAEAIVEKDGVFSISEDLEYADVVQDKGFKELVDSVLQ